MKHKGSIIPNADAYIAESITPSENRRIMKYLKSKNEVSEFNYKFKPKLPMTEKKNLRIKNLALIRRINKETYDQI